VCIFSCVHAAHRNTITSQAAKNVRASEDALFEVFDRLEAFFQRLEIYTEVALDQRMVDMVAKIMAEVLNILGITTKKIKQGRMSKHSLYGCVVTDRTIFREISKEAVQECR
jgi:RecA/RadA recombinase